MAEVFVDALKDAYVDQQNPTTNYGDDQALRVGLSLTGDRWIGSYLRFVIPDVNITQAFLRIYFIPLTPKANGDIMVVDLPGWNFNEQSLNFDTRPSEVGTLTEFYTYNAGSLYWTNIDITAYLQAHRGESVTLGVLPVDLGVFANFYSSEGTEKPNIRIIYEEVQPDQTIAHFTSSPSNAEIWVDGEYSEHNTPWDLIKITSIDFDCVYKLTGYNDEAFHVTVAQYDETTFHKILTPTTPPADYGEISGTITDFSTGLLIQGADVGLNGYNALSTAVGYYEIITLPVGSYTLQIFKDGYDSYTTPVTISKDVTTTKDVSLIPTGEPPQTWEDIPKPPDWPAELDPEWQLLAGALLIKDPILIKNLIVNLGGKGAAGATGIASVLRFLPLVAILMTILGSYPFAGFINEEALQTIDMAIYTSQVNKQWDLVEDLIGIKELMLAGIDKPEWYAYVPVANVILALQRYFQASTFKVGIDKEILTRKIENVQQPQPGDIVGYAQALDQGISTDPYDPIPWGLLIINSNASPAEFDVPGFGWSGTSPYQWEVPPGTYTVEVRSPGYLPSSKSIIVNPYEVKTEDFFLTKEEVIPDTGFVTISSVPIGAKIYMDETFLFEYTDTTIKVPVGAHTFTLKLQDYQDVSTNITVEKDITTSWHEAMELIVAEEEITLTINSIPPGAKIYIDDVYKFEITDTTIKAPAGLHKITLKLEGYKDHNLPYDWPAGSVKTLLVTLELLDGGPPVVDQPADEVVIPLEPVGEPTFNSWKVTIRGTDSVTGADVSAWILIDDVFKGVTTPAVFYLAPESTYNIKLRLSGYRQGEATYTTQPLPT